MCIVFVVFVVSEIRCRGQHGDSQTVNIATFYSTAIATVWKESKMHNKPIDKLDTCNSNSIQFNFFFHPQKGKFCSSVSQLLATNNS